MENKLDQLDPDSCTEIVVNNTPHPAKFRGPDQLLKDLGIVADIEAGVHKAGIIRELEKLGISIDESDILSGPAVKVGDCTASVLDSAS